MFNFFRKRSNDAEITRILEAIAATNREPLSGARTERLRGLEAELRSADPSAETAWRDGLLFRVTWAAPGSDTRRTQFADPLEQRQHDLRDHLRRLQAINMGSADPVEHSISESARARRLAQLAEELASVEAQLAARSRTQAEQEFEALRGPAREAAARVRALQADLTRRTRELLDLEAQLAAAMTESRRLANLAEHLAANEPALAGRRVETAVDLSRAIPAAPGKLIGLAARI